MPRLRAAGGARQSAEKYGPCQGCYRATPGRRAGRAGPGGAPGTARASPPSGRRGKSSCRSSRRRPRASRARCRASAICSGVQPSGRGGRRRKPQAARPAPAPPAAAGAAGRPPRPDPGASFGGPARTAGARPRSSTASAGVAGQLPGTSSPQRASPRWCPFPQRSDGNTLAWQHRFCLATGRIPYPSTVLHFTLELTEARVRAPAHPRSRGVLQGAPPRDQPEAVSYTVRMKGSALARDPGLTFQSRPFYYACALCMRCAPCMPKLLLTPSRIAFCPALPCGSAGRRTKINGKQKLPVR